MGVKWWGGGWETFFWLVSKMFVLLHSIINKKLKLI